VEKEEREERRKDGPQRKPVCGPGIDAQGLWANKPVRLKKASSEKRRGVMKLGGGKKCLSVSLLQRKMLREEIGSG